mgnify:CR=1 FL=1|tara:strand:+ start:1612 stop:2250 length:639 start_codon:yes stop_codon:yes gene_type:complete
MFKKEISLWFVPINSPLKPISFKEINWKKNMSCSRSFQYEHSRGYVREVLSNVLGIPALDIPIISPPGIPPKLPSDMGCVSFSHCREGLLIGWSLKNIGVDIESAGRFFEAKKILNKFFGYNEKKLLKDLENEALNSEVLKLWVRKEAAIKWQKGSIFKDLSKWIFKLENKTIENKIDGYMLNSSFIEFENFYISIAGNINPRKERLIICKY